MTVLILPLIWISLWVLLAVVICAALGIPAHDPRLLWYMAGIFVSGCIGLPTVVLGTWATVRKWRHRSSDP